mmetsp:Transcript_34527/g.84917  ORF Transcript_34527/g.84917 Transcript_34527/m.84917 type:complete len:209 (+) Transcript_34527:358-984(+)
MFLKLLLSLNIIEFCAFLTRFMLSSAMVLRRDLSTGYFSMTASKSARDSWKNSAASVLCPAYAFDPSDLTVAVRLLESTRAVSPKKPPTRLRSISMPSTSTWATPELTKYMLSPSCPALNSTSCASTLMTLRRRDTSCRQPASMRWKMGIFWMSRKDLCELCSLLAAPSLALLIHGWSRHCIAVGRFDASVWSISRIKSLALTLIPSQ